LSALPRSEHSTQATAKSDQQPHGVAFSRKDYDSSPTAPQG
jgi:hypothetical protein